MAQCVLTVKHVKNVRKVEATRIRFSPHQCIARNGGADDLNCLRAMVDYLRTKPGLSLYADVTGQFFRYMLSLVPELRSCARYVVQHEGNLTQADIGNL